jgi:UDP-2,4-diacetamido-2,4,6-trideoxy-beta-L-altropyranose hydrolase
VSAPRVAFVTDAGGEAGLGHFKRCAALARALGARGCAVDALVSAPRDAHLGAVAPGLAVTPLDWWGAPRRVIDAVAGRGVDAYVVDSYHADETLLVALRRAGLVVAIDDLADRPLAVDAVVNGAWQAEELSYRVPSEAVTLLGARYALLDPAFAAAPSPRMDAAVGTVLVTLGGATAPSRIAEAVTAVRAALPQAVIDVVIGLGASELRSNAGVTVHGAVASLRPLLTAADLAVTAGGMTLYECLATATPAVAVCLADNQRPNLQQLGAAGLIVPADFAALGAVVAQVAADGGWRQRLAAGGRRTVDGQGAERVAEVIVRLLATRAPARIG